MPESLEILLPRLRAVAEPTRLRMLAILAHGEFSVTELTRILGQSQPRVSRHLKLLGDCGLLERFREQHWIYYRVPGDTPAGRFARELLGGLDADDAELAGDRMRVAAVLEERAGQGTGEAGSTSAAGRSADEEIAEFLAGEAGERGHDALLYFGRSPGGVLGSLGRRARRAVGMHGRRLEVQRARAMLHSRGLSHCVLQQGELRTLPQAAASFDLVVIDRALAAEARPADAVREAARVLKAGGKLLVVEEYEALERRSEDGNPLALLRDWLAAGGLVCSRLRPADVADSHLLLAVAAADREAVA